VLNDDDPIRRRMAALSKAELLAAVVDPDSWTLEARAAAYDELCRRGITDAPNPSTTTFARVGAREGDRKGAIVWMVALALCGALYVLAMLLK
jgi:hypothetical protein